MRDDEAYLRDMIAACERLGVVSRGVSDDVLLSPEGLHRGTILHLFTVLGEAAKHIAPETRARRPEVPWSDIAGMRDKVVHYYFGLDEIVVADAVRRSVPHDLPALRSLLAELEAED